MKNKPYLQSKKGEFYRIPEELLKGKFFGLVWKSKEPANTHTMYLRRVDVPEIRFKSINKKKAEGKLAEILNEYMKDFGGNMTTASFPMAPNFFYKDKDDTTDFLFKDYDKLKTLRKERDQYQRLLAYVLGFVVGCMGLVVLSWMI